MMRLVVPILVAALAAVISLVSALIPQRNPNAFIVLFALEPIVVLAGGITVLALVSRRRARASGLLGVALYALMVGVTFITIFPIWLPQDDTILGTALVGGLLTTMGTMTALASALILAGRSTMMAIWVGVIAGLLAFVGSTAGGMIAPAAALRPQIVVLLLVLLGVALCARREALRPALFAGVGTILTIAVLVARGPGDWASASTTVKLYSFPIFVIGLAISALIYDLLQTGGHGGRDASAGRAGIAG